MDKKHYQYVQNDKCEYFPCHKLAQADNFNCLFCYCPLYALGDQCGGNFVFNEKGIKDCTNCLIPHCENGYEHVMAHIGDIIQMVRKED